MTIVMCVFVYTGVFLFDFLPIIKEKKKKVILLYGILFVFAFVFSVLHELNIRIPSPAPPIKYFIQTILKLK